MMSSSACDQWHNAITALVEGRFDAISPDEMTQVETHLNECEACAARLHSMTPRPELQTAIPEPSAGRWDAVWGQIEQRSSAPSSAAPTPRRFRVWAALSAAAVVVAAVGLWQSAGLRNGPAWALQLAGAGDVQIESLEIFGDATAIVLGTGDDAEVSVIWVMEEEGT